MILALMVLVIIRNNEVFRFRCMVNELCYQYSLNTKVDGWKKFWDKMPPYGKMVFSFRRIKLETYFRQDEINELLLKNNTHESKS